MKTVEELQIELDALRQQSEANETAFKEQISKLTQANAELVAKTVVEVKDTKVNNEPDEDEDEIDLTSFIKDEIQNIKGGL